MTTIRYNCHTAWYQWTTETYFFTETLFSQNCIFQPKLNTSGRNCSVFSCWNSQKWPKYRNIIRSYTAYHYVLRTGMTFHWHWMFWKNMGIWYYNSACRGVCRYCRTDMNDFALSMRLSAYHWYYLHKGKWISAIAVLHVVMCAEQKLLWMTWISAWRSRILKKSSAKNLWGRLVVSLISVRTSDVRCIPPSSAVTNPRTTRCAMQTGIPKSPPPPPRDSANFPHFVAQLEIFHSLPCVARQHSPWCALCPYS